MKISSLHVRRLCFVIIYLDPGLLFQETRKALEDRKKRATEFDKRNYVEPGKYHL